MIPQHPHFGPVEIAFRAQAMALIEAFEPYSDFNFTSLWSWDVDGRVGLCRLNDNLVARFVDYRDGRPLYSFLGTSRVDETIDALLHASSEEVSEEVHEAALRWVPEVAVACAREGRLRLTPDPDQRDYIFALDRLCTFRGRDLAAKRNFVHRFQRTYTSRVEVLDWRCEGTRAQMAALFDTWAAEKKDADRERRALERLLAAAEHFPSLLGVGVFIEDRLCAASVVEPLAHGYAIVHFEKADTQHFVGIGPYLVQRTAQVLFDHGCRWLNYEQDLGIEGLRRSKSSYAPARFLSKYTVERRSPADTRHVPLIFDQGTTSQSERDAARHGA